MPADLKGNLESVQDRILQACRRAGRSQSEVTLIAVTKTEDEDKIESAFNLGIRHFGESRVQEAEQKIRYLSSRLDPPPIWHMIGHLQSNKVTAALRLFDTIDSLDSLALAEAIDRRLQTRKAVMLEVNVAGEVTKSGFSIGDIGPAFKSISRLPQLEVKGLMTVAPMAGEAGAVRPIFRQLRELRDRLHLEHLSMGMTDDFELAIEEGSTMVRIGRALFGRRTG